MLRKHALRNRLLLLLHEDGEASGRRRAGKADPEPFEVDRQDLLCQTLMAGMLLFHLRALCLPD